MSVHRLNETQAECLVWTYKEGLLSAVGHDLEIKVNHFQITLNSEDQSIDAVFDPNSLEVQGVVYRGMLQKSRLSRNDIQKIHTAIRKDVLKVRQYSQINFRGHWKDRSIHGVLELHGKQAAITLNIEEEEGHWSITHVLDQRQFGIKPFKALMGTLKIKPEVKIYIRIPKIFE